MLSELFNTFIDGMIAGFGMVVVMTMFSILTFKFLEKWITKKISKIWDEVRGKHVDMSGSIDFKEQHKEWNAKSDKRNSGGCP